MASIPDPVRTSNQAPLPDAVNAAPPGHLLRLLEWRTGVEYLAARRGCPAHRRLAAR